MAQHDKKKSHRHGADKVMEVGMEAMLEDDAAAQPQSTADTDIPPTEVAAEALEPLEADETTPEPQETAAAAAPETPVTDETTPPPQQHGDSGDDIAALRAERDSYLDLARRERADFDNYRKRVERDMAQIKRESLAHFLKEFFTPLDDMDRVLQESVKTRDFDALVTGVRIMEENFWRSLAKAGVKRIDAMGKPFDPNLHEAMVTVPAAGVAPGTVVEVYEAGYKLDEYILRPARVVVSRAPDEQ